MMSAMNAALQVDTQTLDPLRIIVKATYRIIGMLIITAIFFGSMTAKKTRRTMEIAMQTSVHLTIPFLEPFWPA